MTCMLDPWHKNMLIQGIAGFPDDNVHNTAGTQGHLHCCLRAKMSGDLMIG